MLATTPDKAIAFYRAQAALGYQYFIANILGTDDDTIDLLATQRHAGGDQARERFRRRSEPLS